jgi:hypothetical protein
MLYCPSDAIPTFDDALAHHPKQDGDPSFRGEAKMKLAISMAICTALVGCGSMAPQPTDIPLNAVIKQVRNDLRQALKEDPVTDIPLTKITLNLKVAATKEAGGEAGVTGTSPVLALKYSAHTSGTMENTVTIEWEGKSDSKFFQFIPAK